MSRRDIHNDGTVRRISRSAGVTKTPKWVFAGSEQEMQEFARVRKVDIRTLHYVESAEQIRRELPYGTRFELVRTGTWYLRPDVEDIEHELNMRREDIG